MENKVNNDEENTKTSITTLTPPLPMRNKANNGDHYGQGSQTPPFYTLRASVPFRWEEQPGKPFPFEGGGSGPATLDIRSLELPPRLLRAEVRSRDKNPSPTTVLEGPYPSSRVSRSLLESSSFRFLKKRGQRVSYYDGSMSFSGVRGGGNSLDRGVLSALLLSDEDVCKSEGFSFKGLSHEDDGAAVLTSDHGGCHGGGAVEMGRKRKQLSLSITKTHFWATIYGAFKQIIPSRSTKWKKDTP